jgi:hypothetical protein
MYDPRFILMFVPRIGTKEESFQMRSVGQTGMTLQFNFSSFHKTHGALACSLPSLSKATFLSTHFYFNIVQIVPANSCREIWCSG